MLIPCWPTDKQYCLLSGPRNSGAKASDMAAKRSFQETKGWVLPCPNSVASARILRRDSNSNSKLGSLRRIRWGMPSTSDCTGEKSRPPARPRSWGHRLIPRRRETRPRPRLQANTCGRYGLKRIGVVAYLSLQSGSWVENPDPCGSKRTHADSRLVAEEAL